MPSFKVSGQAWMPAVLEHQLQGELNLSRGESAADGAEAGAGAVSVRRGEVGVVQRVEHLRPELQLHIFFRQPEVLEEAEVELIQRQRANDIAPGVAEWVAWSVGSATLAALK